jgi:hypothetical protein
MSIPKESEFSYITDPAPSRTIDLYLIFGQLHGQEEMTLLDHQTSWDAYQWAINDFINRDITNSICGKCIQVVRPDGVTQEQIRRASEEGE